MQAEFGLAELRAVIWADVLPPAEALLNSALTLMTPVPLSHTQMESNEKIKIEIDGGPSQFWPARRLSSVPISRRDTRANKHSECERSDKMKRLLVVELLHTRSAGGLQNYLTINSSASRQEDKTIKRCLDTDVVTFVTTAMPLSARFCWQSKSIWAHAPDRDNFQLIPWTPAGWSQFACH